MKLSVNEAKLTGLRARNCTAIQQVWILKSAFGPETFPGLSLGPLPGFGSFLIRDCAIIIRRSGLKNELERRKYTCNVTVEVEKLENRLRYLLSDKLACAGRFLREEYKPKPHDNSNIRQCKREAKHILDELHAITEKILN